MIVNLSAMKGSLVGQSVANLGQFFNVVEAVSDGRPLFGFTANSFDFSPEFQRRCYFGKWFFDLPSAVEREAIWKVYMDKYELRDKKLPTDEGWTGAEIRACSLLSYRLSQPLLESAKFIVPIAVSAADKIDKLRKEANGRFISAAKSGIYEYKKLEIAARPRRILGGEPGTPGGEGDPLNNPN